LPGCKVDVVVAVVVVDVVLDDIVVVVDISVVDIVVSGVVMLHSSKVGWAGPTVSSQSVSPESSSWHSLVSKLWTKLEQESARREQASWQIE
jgi:hypothetical protein